MPNHIDQPVTAKVIPLHDQDWRSDYLRITGEPYSLHGWLLRLHPNDVVHAIREIVRGRKTGRIDMVYRLRTVAGDYHRVRGTVWLMGGQWIGVINCLGRKDSATPQAIAKHLVRSVRNSAAPFLVLMVEWWRLFDLMQ